MKNELGRKITSLTLMAIMLAGGLSFAVPGAIPTAAAANANLFVSAENSQFSNYMVGPQIVEVVVIDSSIQDTDQAKGEPDVTVNGKDFRMVQNTDGNWYGYFADRVVTQIADSVGHPAGTPGIGMDYGAFCTPASAAGLLGITGSLSDTVGVIVKDSTDDASGNPSPTGAPITNTCAGVTVSGTSSVLREVKTPNTVVSSNAQGITPTVWPFIQLYTLSQGGNVVIQYNKGGNVQSTTLTFDTAEQFASLSSDRAKYTQNSQVHVTVTDPWLNIDPTDEDSWTFAANKANAAYGTYYQLFNENGGPVSDGAAAAGLQLTVPELKSLMCEDNCQMTLNADVQKTGTPAITIQDNDDSQVTVGTANDPTTAATTGGTLTAGTVPITITELGPKSGIFGTYDESDTSALKITSNAKRGTSASLSYISTDPATILVANDFATIDIKPTDQEWNSGEEIPIALVDGDANKNSRADEDLDLNNPSVALIPSLSIGDPFTLGENAFTTTSGTDGTAARVGFFNTLGARTAGTGSGNFTVGTPTQVYPSSSIPVQKFSERAMVTPNSTATASPQSVEMVVVDLNTNAKELKASVKDPFNNSVSNFRGLNMLNYDIRSFNTNNVEIALVANSGARVLDGTGALSATAKFYSLANVTSAQGLVSLNETSSSVANPAAVNSWLTTGISDASNIGIAYIFSPVSLDDSVKPIVTDFFTFGFVDDGQTDIERISNEIIRLELEETGDNTSTFAGTLEYKMINQLNILDANLYDTIVPISDRATFVVLDDLDTEDAPRVNYLDLGADGVSTQIADQQDAGTHSGIVSLNADSFKVADTVTVALEDVDLNVDSDLVDIYTVVTTANDTAVDAIGKAGLPTATAKGSKLFSFGALGRLLDITFDDERWASGSQALGGVTCNGDIANAPAADAGLGATGFTLIETGKATGKFTGDFQIPDKYCARSGQTGANGVFKSVTGTDIEVNYLDFRDASGQIVEVGDSAGIRANTGSVSFDRTVYPVPFGSLEDISTTVASQTTGAPTPNGRSVFPIHATGIAGNINDEAETLANGDLILHVRVNDPDFDVSASGEDKIATGTTGPVKVTVSRGSAKMVLATAGATTANEGVIDVDDDGVDANNVASVTRELGPITEIAPDAGIFEFDLPVRYTDGPASSLCPTTGSYEALNKTLAGSDRSSNVLTRFDESFSQVSGAKGYCLLQGDIITVEYNDPTDASGDPNTVTDSATFDLRNGVLQSDKSVYIIGSDMILTLIEPDFDLNNDSAETYDLDLIEWDSDAGTVTMGDQGGSLTSDGAIFDPEPTDFRETGDSTGIFQVVAEIPSAIGNDRLERGEEIVLEYTDWGPSGSDYVGQEDEDVNLTIFTSNFGATVELDQKVYTWTDKVYITIVAPDHNFDSKLIDEVGDTAKDPIKVATRGHKLDNYKLVETGTDTGIFTGEVILTGFLHDADGKTTTGTTANGFDTNPRTGNSANGIATGPTDGYLEADDDDGLTVSFEFSEDETIVGSALIRWNIGEVQWLEASYPASGTGVVRVIDPDMNLNPEAVDNFDVDVWSDSDAGGIDLTVTETNEATGIFEGTVFFSTTDSSSGHRLRVAEGDTITADYQDNTLPNPYTRADELDIEATSLIGTIVPPLERAPASNLRVVDAFGNSLSKVSVDQQVQITADLANGQDREQAFAYLVQIQDSNGVTVSLAWITGSLSSGQSFSPALSWIPTAAGTYTATAFVWESVDNPTALSPPVETTITVS